MTCSKVCRLLSKLLTLCCMQCGFLQIEKRYDRCNMHRDRSCYNRLIKNSKANGSLCGALLRIIRLFVIIRHFCTQFHHLYIQLERQFGKTETRIRGRNARVTKYDYGLCILGSKLSKTFKFIHLCENKHIQMNKHVPNLKHRAKVIL